MNIPQISATTQHSTSTVSATTSQQTPSLINLTSTNIGQTSAVPLELLTSMNSTHILKATPHLTSNVRCFITTQSTTAPKLVSNGTSQIRTLNISSPQAPATTIKIESNENGQINIVNTKKIIRTTPSTHQQPAQILTSNSTSNTLTTLTSLNQQQSSPATTKVLTTSFGQSSLAQQQQQAPTQSSQASSSAPKLILTTNPFEKQVSTVSVPSATNRLLTQSNANLRVISAPSNLTIHQISLASNSSSSSSSTTSNSATNSTSSSSSPPLSQSSTLNVKTINSTKLNETLNSFNGKIRTSMPATTVTNNLNIIKTATLNKITPTSASACHSLNEADVSVKLAEAKLISFINYAANIGPNVNTLTSITSQIQPQQQSPSSSPMKPNIIRKAKQIFDVRETSLQHATDQVAVTLTTQNTNEVTKQNATLAKAFIKASNETDSLIVDLRPKNTRSIASNVSILTNQNHNKSKKIVNISRCSTPPSSTISTIASTAASSLPNTIITKINQMPLSSNSNLAALRVNENISETKATQQQTPSTLSISNPVSLTTDKQIETLLNTAPRKRRKQDLKKMSDDSTRKQLTTLQINGIALQTHTKSDDTHTSELQQVNDDFYLDSNHYDENDEDEHHADVDLSPPPTKITKLNQAKLNSTLKKQSKTSAGTLKNDDETMKKLSLDFEYIDVNGIRWLSKKIKPKLSLLTKSTKSHSKFRQNHFVHYSDVKFKDENKSFDEMILEKERLNNICDWKFHLIFTQLKEMISYENDSLNILSEVNDFIRTLPQGSKIHATIEANSSKHNRIQQQLNEAQLLLENLFTYKDTFNEILSKTHKYSLPTSSIANKTVATVAVLASDCTSDSANTTVSDCEHDQMHISMKQRLLPSKSKQCITSGTRIIRKATFKKR